MTRQANPERRKIQNIVGMACGLAAASAVLAGALGQTQNLLQPQRHLSIERPGRLSDAEAIAVYENIRRELHRSYAMARYDAVAGFGEWQRYNTAPYISATHGQRYVNNYANAVARDYGRFEKAESLPVGSVLAKDSFTVTRSRDVYGGALFVMEKMPAGFNPASHDWRYTMIMPDGSLFGTTKGEGDARVAFCVTCHESTPVSHHQLFFVPEEYRVRRLNPD